MQLLFDIVLRLWMRQSSWNLIDGRCVASRLRRQGVVVATRTKRMSCVGGVGAARSERHVASMCVRGQGVLLGWESHAASDATSSLRVSSSCSHFSFQLLQFTQSTHNIEEYAPGLPEQPYRAP